MNPDMNFCDAWWNVLHGMRVTRLGWNAPGQFVARQTPDTGSKMTASYVYLSNAQGLLVPWVPSQGDLFAQDWRLLED